MSPHPAYFGGMGRRAFNIARAVGWIVLFCGAGTLLVKLAFGLVCWIGGHDWIEALVGSVASVSFGGLIGIESYLWFRDWRLERNRRA